MVEMAKKRNRAHAGKARFIASSVEHADLGDESYDKIFAVHVAALHRPGKALEIVRSRLAPGGSLYLFSQAPGWEDAGQAEEFGAELGRVLEDAGLALEGVRVGPGPSAGVVARKPPNR
jgi:SAM-dependent methyltransferase